MGDDAQCEDAKDLTKGLELFTKVHSEALRGIELQKISQYCTKLDVKKGQVILRHGTFNDKLFLLAEGEAVSVIRDGGVSGIMQLQQDGEILWKYSAGDYFGEDTIVLPGQTTTTRDVIASKDSCLIILPLKSFLVSLGESVDIVLNEMRIQFVCKLLSSVPDFSGLNSETEVRNIALNARHVTLGCKERLSAGEFVSCCQTTSKLLSTANEHCHDTNHTVNITVFVTEGALHFTQRDELHPDVENSVGHLEVGHSIPLASLKDHNLSTLSITAAPGTNLLALFNHIEGTRPAAPESSMVESHIDEEVEEEILGEEGRFLFTEPSFNTGNTDRMHKLTKHFSSEDMIKFGQGAQVPTVSPKTESHKRLLKRSLSSCLELSEDETLGKQMHPPAGYASYRKSGKQLKFLESLCPLQVSPSDPLSGSLQKCLSCPSSLMSVKSQIPRWQTAAQSPKKRKTGVVLSLNSLERIETLGHGAFGTVNLVRHLHSNQVFALKQMDKNQIVAKRQEYRARSEKTIMEKIGHHPFITNFVRSFRDSSHIYLLLEAGLGGDLFDIVVKRPNQRLSLEEIRFIVPQLVLALEFLHRKNVVYRDVKPENSILCVDGYLRLTDFGLAKELEPNGRTYSLCGTPSFIAPEVLTLGGYGCAVDWWGLGVFLFEVATGTFPFVAKNMPSLGAEHRGYTRSYPNNEIFKGLSQLDADFVKFVKDLLNPDPSKRLGRLSPRKLVDDIKSHDFLRDVQWDLFLSREVSPPSTILSCVAASTTLAAANSAKHGILRSASFSEGSHIKDSLPMPPLPPSSNQVSKFPNHSGRNNQVKLWDAIF